jgi:glycosyltransferase involved in cell wall biosynthesis
MIRVCHIISGDLWAGAEVMDYYLLKNLIKFNNIELSSILLNEGRLANEIRSIGLPVDIVDETQHRFFNIIRDSNKILKQKSPDIIHTHGYKANVIAFLSSRHIDGSRLISTQHGLPESIGLNRNYMYPLLHKINIMLLSKSFYKVIAVSNDVRNILINKYGLSDNKVIKIYNGTENVVDPTSMKDGEIFIIGSIGRISPIKDYSLMVEIAKEVYKETDKVHFVLAGDGPDRVKIIDLIKRYRLENIFSLRGFVEDRFEFYKGLDLYLNTSLHEGIPISILEAMSYGIPIIAPNVGGLEEILDDGIQGYLVEGREPKVFANRCLNIYNNKLLKHSMERSAREKVKEKFSNDRMAKEYYNLYLDVFYKTNKKSL